MKPFELRPYQLDAIQQARDRIDAGRLAPLLVAPTGAGKTLCEAEIARLHLELDPSNRVLMVAHRRELIGQIAKTLLRHGITDIGEIIPGAVQRPGARVQVASTQTLRARNMFPPASLVVLDECVTGDTIVGNKRADEIRVGDLVDSWDGHQVVVRRVSRVFVNPIRAAAPLHQAHLITVRTSDGRSLTCTTNHPIWIGGKGYVYASEVRQGDMCRVWQSRAGRQEGAPPYDMQSEVRADGNPERATQDSADSTRRHPVMSNLRLADEMVVRPVAADVFSGVLECDTLSNNEQNESSVRSQANEIAQSHAPSRDAHESIGDAAGTRAYACGPRWQRSSNASPSTQAVESAQTEWGGLGLRGFGDESTHSSALGNRRGAMRFQDRDRGRWPESLTSACAPEGQGEGSVSYLARVDSIEVFESGSDGSFGGRAPGDRVYNFEVEGEHNFFANGILTHNCHHYSSDDWSELARGYPDAIRVGFTATPMRSDGRGMAPAFDSLVVVSTIKELTALGYLVPCRVIAPEKPLRKPNMSHSPVDAYLAHANGRKTIVFADFVANAEKFVSEFQEKGIDAVVVHGELSDSDRKEAFRRFNNGAVLANVGILTEGFDDPPTSCCILARGCGSVGVYLQIVGRVLRTAPGKTDALLIDLTGRSFYDHGPPDADRTYSLTGKGIRKKDELDEEQKYCPVCGQPLETPPNSWPCGVCGHQPEGQIEAPNYTGDELAERYAGKRKETDDKRIETLARWYAEAKSRGHRPWAAVAKYKSVYGSKPPSSLRDAAEMLSRTLACVECSKCGKVTARTYQGGLCGKCAFGGRKTIP